MKRNILFWLIAIMVITSCSNRSKIEKRIDADTEQGFQNAAEFSEIFEKKDSLIKNLDSKQLTKTSCDIYAYIGIPECLQDTQRLNVAVEFLDKAIELDNSNINAFYCLFNIQTAMQNWKEASHTITKIIQKSEPKVGNYIFLGSVYEMIDKPDSSNLAFKQALMIFDKKAKLRKDNQVLVSRAIIIALIYGKDEAIKELDKGITDENKEYLEIARDQLLSSFDKRDYIKTSIFVRPINPKR